MIYDIAIIGGGAAGLNAALYGARGGMKVAVFENTGFGGQINYTYDVDNYIGFPSIGGAELAERMREHVQGYDCEFKNEGIREIKDIALPVKKLVTRRNVYGARTVILATGAKPRKLGVMGEEELAGAGVSYCATCDGAFSRGKTAAVIGGGNTAFEDALYLSSICRRVCLINRSSSFRAAKTLVEKAEANPVIEILTDRRIEKIQGDTSVKSIVTVHSISGRVSVLDTDAVFVAIGRVPESGLLDEGVQLADDGSVITDAAMCTNIPGVYAAGDVRNTPLRQIITAAADGAVAASSAIAYINSQG